MMVKAKDRENWRIWHYGDLISPTFLLSNGAQVPIIPRTACESTGLYCKGREVFENDWLAVDGDGETHKLLVVWRDNEYRAAEDEEVSYNLKNVLEYATCKVVGNLYD